MSKNISLIYLFLLVITHCQPKSQEVYTLAIRNVTFIDVENGTALPSATVLIKDSLISKVLPNAEVQLPDTVQVVDGSGKFLIPGLWDMHVHVGLKASPSLQLPLFLANGITGIRDMSDRLATEGTLFASIRDKKSWHQQIVAGELNGPRMLSVASPIINGKESRVEGLPEFTGPENEEQAKALVHFLKNEMQYDFIKVYNHLNREAYFALMEEAKLLDIPVVGHRPLAVSAIEASQAGQKSIEHARMFLQECNPKAEFFRTEKTQHSVYDKQYMIENFSDSIFAEICSVMVANDTYYCPTHVTREFDASVWDSEYLNNPLLRYIPKIQQQYWEQDAEGNRQHDDVEVAQKVLADFYRKGLEITGKAHKAGVKILAGTDANDSYIFSGFSYHDELEKLAEAGLRPVEILQAATLNGAAFENRLDMFGTIAPGKYADMVLLDKNPLDDIANTRTIRAVFLHGRHYSHEQLENMKKNVETAANAFNLNQTQ